MKSWKEETWRGRIKMIAFALTPVTVLVLGAEALTATALDRRFGNEIDPLCGRRTYVFHMGRYPWSHVSRTAINSLGFPDDEFVNIRPKGSCTHVVFVGDSFVFGQGVQDHQTVAAQFAAPFFRRRMLPNSRTMTCWGITARAGQGSRRKRFQRGAPCARRCHGRARQRASIHPSRR